MSQNVSSLLSPLLLLPSPLRSGSFRFRALLDCPPLQKLQFFQLLLREDTSQDVGHTQALQADQVSLFILVDIMVDHVVELSSETHESFDDNQN